MLGDDGSKNAAAHIELGDQAHESGLRGSDEVVENLICYRFVKCAFVAVRPDIQLQALELDTFAIGNVVKVQGGKIGLTGFWAKAGELGNLHADQKIPFRVRVRESFQSRFRFARHLIVKSRSARIPVSYNRDACDLRVPLFRVGGSIIST